MASRQIQRFFRFEGATLIPEPLWAVPHPPVELFIEGNPDALSLLNRLPRDGFAVVGTRLPQPRSLSLVKHVLSELRGTSLIVISGLARGIDTMAHRTALEAGLPTIAILGCGLDREYPQENSLLRREIVKTGGLIVSEFPMQAEPRGYHFLNRNRLISGWSEAVWIVQARQRSGALNTAKWAREQDRICFATPSFPGDPCFAGNERLLSDLHAKGLWSAESLGEVYLNLTSELALQKSVEKSSVDKDQELRIRIAELTGSKGGAQVSELLDWSFSKNQATEEFFLALRRLIDAGLVTEEQGHLTAII